MIELGYNFHKKSLDKIKRYKNPVIDVCNNGVTETESTVSVFYRSYATITLKVDKKDVMTVYKNY